jgi:thioredoxin-related protein
VGLWLAAQLCKKTNAAMQETIHCFTETEAEKAFQLAKQKQLPVLVDFWAPGCKGCKKMDIITYQSLEIQKYVSSNFQFVKYDITNRSAPKLQSSPILWTPTFIVFANDGSEIRKITGYLNEQSFVIEMEIGRALSYLRKAQPQTSLQILEKLMAETANKSLLPEVLYWAGVSSFFLNKRNADSLVPFWQLLLGEYPESVWAQRADILTVVI